MNLPFEKYLQAFAFTAQGNTTLHTSRIKDRDVSTLSIRDIEEYEATPLNHYVTKTLESATSEEILIMLRTVSGHLQPRAYDIFIKACCSKLAQLQESVDLTIYCAVAFDPTNQTKIDIFQDTLARTDISWSYTSYPHYEHLAYLTDDQLTTYYHHHNDTNIAIEMFKRKEYYPEDPTTIFNRLVRSDWSMLLHTLWKNPIPNLLKDVRPSDAFLESIDKSPKSFIQYLQNFMHVIGKPEYVEIAPFGAFVEWYYNASYPQKEKIDIQRQWDVYTKTCEGLSLKIELKAFLTQIVANRQNTMTALEL